MSEPEMFDRLWSEIEPIGRDKTTGGYRRYALTSVDFELGEWFAASCRASGLDVVEDRMGNQWGWWGHPDTAAGQGVVTGSHVDSVPDGGAFDGPLGVVSGLVAVRALKAAGFIPTRPVGVVRFVDEEGARFGVACAGSRVITGAMTAERACGLKDPDGLTMAEALAAAGRDPSSIGVDPEALDRVGTFVELHVEQGRGLVEEGRPVAVGSDIWPHGRWRVDFSGEANHAGTTRLENRRDAMLGFAEMVLSARTAARVHGCLATVGKVAVQPGGVNAIPSAVTGWLDARGADEAAVRAAVAQISAEAARSGAGVTEESWTDPTRFDEGLASRLSALLDGAPLLGTGAGHDAGILSTAGIRTGMLFVRNPTGVSHAPAERAERADCLAGVTALTAVLRDLAGERS